MQRVSAIDSRSIEAANAINLGDGTRRSLLKASFSSLLTKKTNGHGDEEQYS